MSKNSVVNKNKKLIEKDLNMIDSTNEVKSFCSIIENISNKQTDDTKELFNTLRKAMDLSEVSDEYKKIVQQLLSDNSKALDKSTTSEEIKEILDRNLEIFKIADEREKERINNIKEIKNQALEKDTENKESKWKLIKCASYVIIGLVGFTTGVVVGNKDLGKK